MTNYNDIKSHYDKAAEQRDRRLRTTELNASQVNHRIRLRIIKLFLKKVGSAHNGIDIGTGTGVWAEILSKYCDKVIGVDFAKNNIKIAINNAAENNLSERLSYIHGDAQRLQVIDDDSFDVATHISVLQHLPDRQRALNRVNEILRENGRLIILVHNKSCIYNRNLKIQRKRGATLSLNKYNSIKDIRRMLDNAGFQIESIRLCWFCINDLFFFGMSRSFLRPIIPLRKAAITFTYWFESLAGHLFFLSPLFREIVILAKKQEKRIAMKNKIQFYQNLWQNEIDNVIGEDYHDYEIRFREKAKMKILEAYLAAIPEKQSILEIGCGSGRILSQFKNQFGIEKGYGIDISDKAVSFAREHHKDCEFLMLNIDENALPYKDGEIDIVLLCDIVEHVTDVDHLIREAVRVGKHVVIKVPLEKTLLEYIRTGAGCDTSINKLHPLGHIQSFSLGYFRKYFLAIAPEIGIQMEMINVKQLKQSRRWILRVLGHLLYHTPLYRFVFTTELGIHISKVVR